MTTCMDCGALHQNERDCEAVFNDFLALEFTDPEYGAVHFLTVACYMIQHRKYSLEGLMWIEQKLRDYLEKGRTAAQIRRQASQEARQERRSWKVTHRLGEPEQQKNPWTMTIIDVALRSHSAESYRALVAQWAEATLKDMQPLLKKTNDHFWNSK